MEQNRTKNYFKLGFFSMFPVIMGIIPFGAVMGTVSAEAKLSFFQTFGMNFFVFAGAAQLAAVDLMTKHTASLVVVVTGLVINLRFLLYSAALAPTLRHSGFWTKLAAAHLLTDQGYAVMSAHHARLRTNSESIQFYFGTSTCMLIAWYGSVIAGFIFGNFAPASWALDYAVPLSFAALVIPTLKNKNYIFVAIFSSLVSILLNSLPYRTGLIATALLAISLAAVLTKKKGPR